MVDQGQLEAVLADCERKAFEALDRYEFARFAQFAGNWAMLNGLLPGRRPSPFAGLRRQARAELEVRGHRTVTPDT